LTGTSSTATESCAGEIVTDTPEASPAAANQAQRALEVGLSCATTLSGWRWRSMKVRDEVSCAADASLLEASAPA
jgi:hypothetical protein